MLQAERQTSKHKLDSRSGLDKTNIFSQIYFIWSLTAAFHTGKAFTQIFLKDEYGGKNSITFPFGRFKWWAKWWDRQFWALKIMKSVIKLLNYSDVKLASNVIAIIWVIFCLVLLPTMWTAIWHFQYLHVCVYEYGV